VFNLEREIEASDPELFSGPVDIDLDHLGGSKCEPGVVFVHF
jgi:hypothetical protein